MLRKARYLLMVVLGILVLTACTPSTALPEEGGTPSVPQMETSIPSANPNAEVTSTTMPNPARPQPGTGPQGPMAQAEGQPCEHEPQGPRGKEAPGHGHGPGKHSGEPPAVAGRDNPWRQFHQQAIPEDFAGKENPIPAEADSLSRGQAIYEAQCASCHGETGMGDGPVAESLDPPPAPVAHTSCRLSDAYLFWRIHDGGVQWGTAMPPFGEALSEEDIWHVINYLRSLEPCP